jgi:hypothetical protein
MHLSDRDMITFMHVNPTSYSVVAPFTSFPSPFTISRRAGKSKASSIPVEYRRRHHTIKLSRPIGSSRPRRQETSHSVKPHRLRKFFREFQSSSRNPKKTPANDSPHDGSGKCEPDTCLHLGTKIRRARMFVLRAISDQEWKVQLTLTS